jgi:hypothetical protein
MNRALLLPDPQAASFEAYRNIYTIKPSQDLFDDLVDPEDFPILQTWDNETSQIQHGVSLKDRVFQYGNVAETLYVFDKNQWSRGRFGDGKTYGVWYGALEKETSVQEALYWVYRNSREDIAASKTPVVIDRKMLVAQIQTERMVDLRTLKEYAEPLVSEDYSFCQTLGAYAVENKINLFLTPSARHPGGTCVPVFSASAIQSDRMVYYIHFTFTRDGTVQITTDEDRPFVIPDAWK